HTSSKRDWSSDVCSSDLNPMRRYQVLRSFEEAPQLPSGYAAMIGVAYFPPLWRKVMDKRVLAHYDGDITRANIQPAKREKVLARYGAGATAVAEPEVLVDTDIAPDQHSPTGEYVCPNCGHHYSEKAGEPREGFPPGTPWADIPATWSCSACGVRDKIDFRPVT